MCEQGMHQTLMATTQTRMLTLKHEYVQDESKMKGFRDSLPPWYVFHGKHSGISILISGLNCSMVYSEADINGRFQTVLLSKPQFIYHQFQIIEGALLTLSPQASAMSWDMKE